MGVESAEAPPAEASTSFRASQMSPSQASRASELIVRDIPRAPPIRMGRRPICSGGVVWLLEVGEVGLEEGEVEFGVARLDWRWVRAKWS